jgi:hypothetical protein
VAVWKSKNPQEAVAAIVDRLLEIDVPFLPDLLSRNIYCAEPLNNGSPPKVYDLMIALRLSEKILNNISGFFYMRPAFKNFSNAFLEVRGIDTQSKANDIYEIANFISGIVYDDAAREKLLDDFSHFTPDDVVQFHAAASLGNLDHQRNTSISGVPIKRIVENIMSRGNTSYIEQNHFYQNKISA